MKERESEPKLQCWGDKTGASCEGLVKVYAFVESPTKPALNFCNLHLKPFTEAMRPLQK